MIIQKAKIRNLSSHLKSLAAGTKFIPGIRYSDSLSARVKRIGFDEPLTIGDSILPRGVGRTSLFNAEGKYLVRKDLPMETAYRTVDWHWEEWHGPYTVERSKFIDVSYKRYPREFISPPSIELSVQKTSTDQIAIVGPQLEFNYRSEKDILHIINLFLEIFGECEIFTENLESFNNAPLRRLNWEILPPGKMPWEHLKEKVKPLINVARKGNQSVITHRLETISGYGPDFTAIGKGGFKGYIVLGFVGKGLYTLESIYYGNATYVFGDKWEDLSKLTKAEVLNNSLQKARVIHREGWEGKIEKLIGGEG